jgi:hypothetical protein
MNTIENKRMLWEIICEMNILRPGLDKQEVLQLFEYHITQIDKNTETIADKNKSFLKIFVPIINNLQISDKLSSSRETFLEERIEQIQQQPSDVPLYNIFDPIDVHQELVTIKQLLHKILEKLN